jgi:hypothetical protein
MGRLGTMTENGSQLGSTTYKPWGALASLVYDSFTENRTFNSLQQMTRQTTSSGGTAVMDMQYNFTAGQNNGRIANSVDGVTGENVAYTYDTLNRLIKAETGGRQC